MFYELGGSPEGKLDPKSLLDTPIPGEFYPRRSFKDVLEGIRSLGLRIATLMDSDGDTKIEDKKNGRTYWFDINGRMRIEHTHTRQVAYVYDEQGRVCAKHTQEYWNRKWDIKELNRFVYDSPTSKEFTVTPLVFNDGIVQ